MTGYMITVGDDGSVTLWVPSITIPRGMLGKFSNDVAGAAVQAQAKVPIVLANRPKGGPA